MTELDDEIPQSVLLDYQNRTVVSVENLVWSNADRTVLTADVLFAELASMGPLPFTTTDDADTRHGQEVWDRAAAGEFGPIADFVPPTPEELRAAMPALTARQFRLGLHTNGLLTGVQAAIDAMEEPERTIAGIEWEYATTIERGNPLVSSLAAALELTEEQIDAMWVQALNL